ncbi:MAG: hypothetical protein ABSB76_28810 [Streptosporangiaceae bacterium]|jgi:hypothetical protein
MRRARLRRRTVMVLASVASALIAAGLFFGLTGSARATQVPVRLVAFDCPGQQSALVRPRTFVIACADANSDLGRLAWTSWTPGLASATGVLEENDCTPYCAAGHFHAYPAVVVFWGNTAVRNHPGEHAYTEMTIILTGARPRYYDYLTRRWVTAPATQTSALTIAPALYRPGV